MHLCKCISEKHEEKKDTYTKIVYSDSSLITVAYNISSVECWATLDHFDMI